MDRGDFFLFGLFIFLVYIVWFLFLREPDTTKMDRYSREPDFKPKSRKVDGTYDTSLKKNLVMCDTCASTISPNAEVCPNCGEILKESAGQQIWDFIQTIIKIAFIVLLVVFFGLPLLKLIGVMLAIFGVALFAGN